jgi:hypothetical protein
VHPPLTALDDVVAVALEQLVVKPRTRCPEAIASSKNARGHARVRR